jgi:hypothetical protein
MARRSQVRRPNFGRGSISFEFGDLAGDAITAIGGEPGSGELVYLVELDETG